MDGRRPPPHTEIEAPRCKASRVGRRTVNAELCPDRGHHIPLEPHRGGEGSPGQEGQRKLTADQLKRTQDIQRLQVLCLGRRIVTVKTLKVGFGARRAG